MFTIRRARVDDVEGILKAHTSSIREVASRDHSPLQVSGWSDHLRVENYLHAMKEGGETYFVADEDGKILGFSSLKGTEVAAVYVSSAGVGRDVGRTLYEAVENLARERGIQKLSLSSSLTAEGFYKRMGYGEVERSEHLLRSAGVKLPCVRMCKSLVVNY